MHVAHTEDPDIELEPELPPLKQVLGEEVLRKLKPKEKKRQDVLNGKLFFFNSEDTAEIFFIATSPSGLRRPSKSPLLCYWGVLWWSRDHDCPSTIQMASVLTWVVLD